MPEHITLNFIIILSPIPQANNLKSWNKCTQDLSHFYRQEALTKILWTSNLRTLEKANRSFPRQPKFFLLSLLLTSLSSNFKEKHLSSKKLQWPVQSLNCSRPYPHTSACELWYTTEWFAFLNKSPLTKQWCYCLIYVNYSEASLHLHLEKWGYFEIWSG